MTCNGLTTISFNPKVFNYICMYVPLCTYYTTYLLQSKNHKITIMEWFQLQLLTTDSSL